MPDDDRWRFAPDLLLGSTEFASSRSGTPTVTSMIWPSVDSAARSAAASSAARRIVRRRGVSGSRIAIFSRGGEPGSSGRSMVAGMDERVKETSRAAPIIAAQACARIAETNPAATSATCSSVRPGYDGSDMPRREIFSATGSD